MDEWITVSERPEEPSNIPLDEPAPEADAEQVAEDAPAEASETRQTGWFRRNRWQVIMLLSGIVMIGGWAAFVAVGRTRQAAIPDDILVVADNTYSETLVGQAEFVNPLLAESQVDKDLASLVYAGLTSIDEYGQPVPDLAESWEVSEDGLTYIFRLRRDATWHDGKPVTAADVDFTMAILRDPDFPGPSVLGEFWRTVETYADDDYTVRFILTQPLTAFPEYASIGILPAHWLQGVTASDLPADSINLDPIGAGRLDWISIEERAGRQIIRLQPYPGFYRPESRIGMAEVVFYVEPTPREAFATLGVDSVAMGGLSGPQIEAVFEQPRLEVYSAPLPIVAAIIFNQQDDGHSFFQSEEVRVALWVALNRNSLIQAALPREAILADSIILQGNWAYDSTLAPPVYDPDEAGRRLDEAGWSLSGATRAREGERLSFTLLVGDNPGHRVIADEARKQWREIGVDVTVRQVSTEQLFADLQGEERDFEAALVEFSQLGLADPDPYAFWHQSQIQGGQNISGFSDPDMSEAIEIARRDPNGVRRAELYRSFQQWFIERGAAILLYHPVYHFVASCQLQGIRLTIQTGPSDRYRSMHRWEVIPAERLDTVCSGG